jgi:SAM-dependent methyltransferase
MTGTPQIFDRHLIMRRRARHSACARQHDFLLHRVADDFVERLSVVRRTFSLGACVGAYHGVISERLRQDSNIATIINIEPSSALLEQCAGPKAVAEDERLPLSESSLDLVVSGLSLQLVNDVPGVLAQVRRALKPDGLFLAAVLGGETLRELRESWLIAEEELSGGASPRVAPCADVRELGRLLQRAGFALPVADSDVVQVTYATPLALMNELRAMAASNMLRERRRVPVTRRLLMRAAEVYSDRFALPNGRVPATFEIINLTAWAPHESQQKPLARGSAKMRLADALGVEERSTGDPAAKPPANRVTKE